MSDRRSRRESDKSVEGGVSALQSPSGSGSDSSKKAKSATTPIANAAADKNANAQPANNNNALPVSTSDAMIDDVGTVAAASGALPDSRKRPAKSIRASDTKRKKLVPRCTSPSHFLLENSESGASAAPASAAASIAAATSSLAVNSPLPSALNSDPTAPSSVKLSESNTRIDSFLHSIASMYYRNHMQLNKDTNGPAEVWVSSDYDKLEYPTLDLLISPLRKPHVLDNWCPREIALFESGICAVGKDFHAIANLITTKSCKECVDFYYVWKKSSHYAMWKNFGKPSKKPHTNKEEQWKAIREQMNASNPAASTTTTANVNGKKEN